MAEEEETARGQGLEVGVSGERWTESPGIVIECVQREHIQSQKRTTSLFERCRCSFFPHVFIGFVLSVSACISSKRLRRRAFRVTEKKNSAKEFFCRFALYSQLLHKPSKEPRHNGSRARCFLPLLFVLSYSGAMKGAALHPNQRVSHPVFVPIVLA